MRDARCLADDTQLLRWVARLGLEDEWSLVAEH